MSKRSLVSLCVRIGVWASILQHRLFVGHMGQLVAIEDGHIYIVHRLGEISASLIWTGHIYIELIVG